MTELETMQRAKMYMDKLAQGIDPITGREIPEDSTLNNVREPLKTQPKQGNSK